MKNPWPRHSAPTVSSRAPSTRPSLGEQGIVTAHRSRHRAGLAPVAPVTPDAAGAAVAPVTPDAAELLAVAGLRVSRFDDYRRLKWSKLLLNLPANAACAILDWTPAQVMAHRPTAGLEARDGRKPSGCWQPCASRPCAWHHIRSPSWRPSFRSSPRPGWPAASRPPSQAAVAARCLRCTSRSSGKRSEVSWLNGAVARAGAQAGIPTPVNDALTSVLSEITEAPETWPAWRNQPDRLQLQGCGRW